MATSTYMMYGAAQNPPALFKCRLCRQVLFNSDSILSATILNDISGTLWYINDDAQPLWIRQAIQEALWTRGKLACPKCGGRLGSFDYLTPSIIHLQNYQGPWSCTQVIRSRVDCETFALTNLGGGMTLLVPQAQANIHGGDSSCVNNTDYPVRGDNHGALPQGCWYLNRDEVDTTQPSFVSQNCNVNLTSEEYDNLQTGEDNKKCLNASPEEADFKECVTEVRETPEGMGEAIISQDEIHDGSPPVEVMSTSSQAIISQDEIHDGSPPVDAMSTSSQAFIPQDEIHDNSPRVDAMSTSSQAIISPDEIYDDSPRVDAMSTSSQAIISQDEIHDGSPPVEAMSTSSRKADLRAQRQERNRRKNDRRKLRRQERWEEAEEAERKELLLEEEKLQSNPDEILGLLQTCQSSRTIREALTCPICLDLYFNPHVCLPCRHIFCEPCLRHLAQATQAVPCPLCRTVIQHAKLQCELRAAIVEMIPRMTEHRKQAERKSLSRSYPLPGQASASNFPWSWNNPTMAGHGRNEPNHFTQRRRNQELSVVEIVLMFVGDLSADTLVELALIGLIGIVYIFAIFIQHAKQVHQSTPR